MTEMSPETKSALEGAHYTKAMGIGIAFAGVLTQLFPSTPVWFLMPIGLVLFLLGGFMSYFIRKHWREYQ